MILSSPFLSDTQRIYLYILSIHPSTNPFVHPSMCLPIYRARHISKSSFLHNMWKEANIFHRTQNTVMHMNDPIISTIALLCNMEKERNNGKLRGESDRRVDVFLKIRWSLKSYFSSYGQMTLTPSLVSAGRKWQIIKSSSFKGFKEEVTFKELFFSLSCQSISLMSKREEIISETEKNLRSKGGKKDKDG